MTKAFGVALVLCVIAVKSAAAQTTVDPALAQYIDAIQAIDNHAHPMRNVPHGAPADTDFDALPLDGIPPFDLPARLKPDDPIWRAAQAALYGVSPNLSGDAYHNALKSAVTKTQASKSGAAFALWALDQSKIQVIIANRITMAPELPASRFKWIAFVDPLMLPLRNPDQASLTPDRKPLYARETRLLGRYMRDLDVRALPANLDDYVARIVNPTLAKMKAGGAIGIKFEAAYLRPLDFDPADHDAAARAYARYVETTLIPTHVEYKTLQDYLFRVIAREAGRLGLVIQIHVLETFGGYYSPAGSAPHLLESAFNDPALRKTRFIMVHGGWPLVGETQGEISKPNVYTDISMIDDILSPTVLAGVLRQWLGEYPEKVLFGTDAFDGGVEQGWEQVAWVGSTTARRALAIALTAMMRDGDITRERAQQLARMVLRENTAAVYGLPR